MRSIIQEAIILPLVTCVSGRQVNMKQKLEEIKTLAKRTNGIFRTADLKKLGFTAYEIRKMLEKHFIGNFPNFANLVVEKRRCRLNKL